MEPSPSPRHAPAARRSQIHARRWFLLAIMCLSLVLVVMSVSGLVTAIPTMQQELDASASDVQWIIDAYAVVFAGTAAHRRCARRPVRPQARAARSASSSSGSAHSSRGSRPGASQVIAGRAVMGIGAAFVMPATLSIITTIFPPEERSRAIAVWAGFAGAGGALGPIVSGRAPRSRSGGVRPSS